MANTRHKPTIAFLTDTIEAGGAERIAVTQAKGVDPQRFRKILVVTRQCDLTSLRGLEQYGVEVIGLNRAGRWDAQAFARLYGIFKDADIVHAHKHGSILHAIAWGKLARRPRIVAQLHTKVSELGFTYNHLTRWACQMADWVVMISQVDFEEHMAAWHLDPSKVSIVYNGVDVDSFGNVDRSTARAQLGLDEHIKVVGSVGRVDRYKGYEFFLESAALLRQTLGQDVRFLIAGGIPEETYRLELEARARDLGIAEAVIFLGHRRDMDLVLAGFDVFVLSSVVECLPVALLEAMATGLPVVATTVGGIPEVVVNGESGLLVPPRDAQALASAALRVLGDPELGERMARAARERIRARFSLATMTQGIEEIYGRLL